MRPRIAILDYGIGNLRSAEKALQRVGADATLTTDAREVAAADGVVLPGVGAMGRCMDALAQSGLREVALDAVAGGRPFMGICVGMQMLHAGSEEDGGVVGLGVFSGTVRLLPDNVKRPQMQWNVVRSLRPNVLLAGIADPAWVYFVHSYAPEMTGDTVAVCEYGNDLTAIVERDNVCGTQFHPEKSGRTGLELLANFVRACARVAV
jgi:glutamine amidotransferase